MPRPYLKFCPFCGNEDIRLRNRCEVWQGQELYTTIVFCNHCSGQVEKLAFLDRGESPEGAEMEAVCIWNHRRTPKGFAEDLRREAAAKDREQAARVERGNIQFRRIDASRKQGELWTQNVRDK